MPLQQHSPGPDRCSRGAAGGPPPPDPHRAGSTEAREALNRFEGRRRADRDHDWLVVIGALVPEVGAEVELTDPEVEETTALRDEDALDTSADTTLVWEAITTASAMNRVTAQATTQRRMARVRRCRSASRWATECAPGLDLGPDKPPAGRAGELGGVMITSMRWDVGTPKSIGAGPQRSVRLL